MGQTLSNGVYLPNEGERNCYAGLASNWQILNTAVGNIAEKAPLVHTHGNISNDGKVGTTANQPLITGTGGVIQAGAFGNQANTFCEGNDSRLSDARTPVAHTHTKSDVTDLLNSNFIPSANNSYDLGSASKQWLNTYSKGYYYNGTAWGLDKANTWTASQRMSCNPTIWDMKNTTYTLGTVPSGNKYLGFIFYDSADTDMGRLCVQCHRNGNNYYILGLKSSDGTNTYDGALRYSASQTNERAFYPEGNTDLGTSTNKWKTLNGVNPGALSLPSGGTTENTDWYNVAGDILPTGGNATDFSGNANFFTPAKDGWLALSVVSCESITVWVLSLNYGLSVVAPSAYNNRQLIIPVVAGKQVEIKVKGTRWYSARLIMPQGNV